MNAGAFQITVLVVFAIMSAVLFAVFYAVARQSRRNVADEAVTETGYRLRRYWLAFLAVGLLGALVVSAFALPYPDASAPRTEVKVTGYQFNWTVTPDHVPAGVVRFHVTSSDVNHGLGLYDPDGVLVGQVQAMPDYTNTVDMKLTKPGEYSIDCLEYCGLKHHEMIRGFTVDP